ncbi:hypothetical protein E8E12_004101 [Didymella heteroderae]|uniref:Uncharacterized protein n=1 Tax=Didymella heteroderae TaxID=1769908 RepID=A0A9P4WI75_9PLEO|nr:hypothetical protein E8E12_004101 [Didymella heteroderae]
MRLHITITLLFVALLNFAHALPAGSGDLTVQPFADTVALIDPTAPITTLTTNATTALFSGILTHDPVAFAISTSASSSTSLPAAAPVAGAHRSLLVHSKITATMTSGGNGTAARAGTQKVVTLRGA